MRVTAMTLPGEDEEPREVTGELSWYSGITGGVRFRVDGFPVDKTTVRYAPSGTLDETFRHRDLL